MKLRCRLLGHKVAKSRRFFLTERNPKCDRCGTTVSAKSGVKRGSK